MARYGLLGEHLGHSYSPQIHARLGSAPYALFEVGPAELDGFILQGPWDGINVTVPYKVRAAELSHERSARVEALGAANTLIRRSDGTIFAENTDALGFAALLERFARSAFGSGAVDALRGRPVLVLGTGGSSRAVSYVLEQRCAARIVHVSRSGPIRADNAHEVCGDAALIVNSTPVGMYPNCPATPLDAEQLKRFGQLEGVIDIVYNPRITGLCLAAESLGLPWTSGLPMLVWQAIRSSELFQGRRVESSLAERIIEEIDRRNANICLIGMPGSGKTTLGRQLAGLLSRPFVDLDDACAAESGRTPRQIIEEQGEDAFRALETKVCSVQAARSGLVIATGGGIVTRPGNYALLHQNSTIVFVDRPLDQLSSEGRPLSQKDGVAALAAQRMPRYRAWADVAFARTDSVQDDARTLKGLLGL